MNKKTDEEIAQLLAKFIELYSELKVGENATIHIKNPVGKKRRTYVLQRIK